MAPSLLTADDTSKLITVSRRTLDRLVNEGRFPQPITLPCGRGTRGRRLAWRREDVETWIAQLPTANVGGGDRG